MSRKKREKLNNAQNRGFTLVELIVILVLLMILITLSIGGLFAWQDWTRFKQENTGAENIFYAAQNQLNELSATGMMDDKVNSVLDSLPAGHILGNPNNPNYFDGNTISFDAEGGGVGYYNWYVVGDSEGTIWKNTPNSNNITTPDSASNYQGSIYYLSADRGDFDDYLSGDLMNAEGKKDTVLLFDLITPYIADKSVLNGAILLEFSPEAAQVFSVSYSDRIDSFSYNSGNRSIESTVNSVSALDRRESERREFLIGYYSADSLSVPLVGRSKGVTTDVYLVNDETLNLVINTGTTIDEQVTYDISLYKGNDNDIRDRILAFSLDALNIDTNIDNAEEAGKNPITVSIKFYSGIYKNDGLKEMRIPVWVDKDADNNYEIHIAFDAADAQAQSCLYKDRLAPDERFLNTYSFYRFGISMNTLGKVCCGVSARKGTEAIGEENKSNAQHPTFKSATIGDDGSKVYEIENGRHLYNVRFETDYKDSSYGDRTFKLVRDIDWAEFCDRDNNGCDYYLNSYSREKVSGINYSGLDYTINHVADVTAQDFDQLDTRNFTFPGFRKLSVDDVFTGLKDESIDAPEEEKATYTISNLVITFSGNIHYGVYGEEVINLWNLNSVADYGSYISDIPAHSVHALAMKGRLPIGLFAENAGTIEYLTLNKHQVIGMEMLKYGSGDENLVYTNMVGGFVGNNLGFVKGLTLRDVNNLTDNDSIDNESGITHVNGKTDVGGIIGRQSWVTSYYPTIAEDSTDTLVVLDYLKNYGNVTGMEKVGGIVGDAYVIRKDQNLSEKVTNLFNRLSYYNDGYELFGKYDDKLNLLNPNELKTFTGQSVKMVDYIEINHCINRGDVSGDSLIHDYNLVYYPDGTANDLYRCSFIGGIAGITIDGVFIDSQSDGYSALAGDYERVKVLNCSAYRLYDNDDLEMLKSPTSGNSNAFPEGDIRDRLEHDFYVGSLVGYSRLTTYTNCSNEPQTTELSDKKAFVFGRNYVGGFFGCYDTSFIDSDAIAGRYYFINNVNTIGVMHVGGFAGGAGIGDDSRQSLYIANPSKNEGSQPSQVERADIPLDGIYNKAVVLGVRRKALSYDIPTGNNIKNSIVYLQDREIDKGVTTKGSKSKETDRVVSLLPDSCIGGVVGSIRFTSSNLDNMQTDEVKNYAATLIGINGGFNGEYDDYMNVDQYSYYGGNAVGGIFGKICGGVNCNSASGKSSKVDALIYGEDSVGGCVGGSELGSGSVQKVTIEDSVIAGRDMVGGLSGKHTLSSVSGTGCKNYKVYGRYSVGGVIGHACKGSSDANVSEGVKVIGEAYVGGYAGTLVQESNNLKGTISGVDVEADYFAGGLIGAFYGHTNNCQTEKVMVSSSKLAVKANVAFAGGFAGLYGFHKGTDDGNGVVVVEDISEVDEKYSSAIGTSKQTGYLIRLAAAAKNNSAVSAVKESETNTSGNWGLNVNTSQSMSNATLKFNNAALPINDETVTAPIFAGGIFGYIPNGLRVTFDFQKNNSNTATTISPNVSATGNPISAAFADDEISEVNASMFSYTGGVIGRVPDSVKIMNVSYNGEYGILTTKGDYLGQIAEVNDGIITKCVIRKYHDESSHNKYTGGLAGLNSKNGIFANDNSFAENTTLKGSQILGGYVGRNNGTIILSGSTDGWGDWVSINDNNLTEITVGADVDGSAIGFLVGQNDGTINVVGSDISSSKINGAKMAGLYAGINEGHIYDNRVQTVLENADSLNAPAGSVIDGVHSITAKLSVSNVETVGLITGSNVGEVDNIVTSMTANDSCEVTATNCTFLGGIMGRNGDGVNEGKVDRTFNIIPVNGAAYVGGIAGVAGGKSTITRSENRGNINASTAAAGILGWSNENVSNENVNDIRDCVNIGEITAATDESMSAGIAGRVNHGVVDLCRNYGTAAYGMSASADDDVTFSNNLEASGNNEGVPSSDEEGVTLTKNPIAPVSEENRSKMVRNFYVYGVCDGGLDTTGNGCYGSVYVGPGTEDHLYTDINFSASPEYAANSTAASTFFTGKYSIKNSGADVLYGFEEFYLQGYNRQYVGAIPLAPIDPENGEFIRNLYMELAGTPYSGGELNSEFKQLLQGAFYLFYNKVNNGNWSSVNTHYDNLINLIRLIKESNAIPSDYSSVTQYDNGYVAGTDIGFGKDCDAVLLQDTTSHWPKQLYYYTDENDICTLVYHRWNSYYTTPIGELASNISTLGAGDKYTQIDSKFVTMVQNEDEYPNYDTIDGENNTLISRGFLPQVQEP